MTEQMTKKERVIAAFKGEETDRVPMCMWKHVPQRYWSSDDLFAENQAASFRNTDVDFMKLSADGYFGWKHPLLSEETTPSDLYRLEPVGRKGQYVDGQIERTKKVIRALKGECISLYLVFAPLSALRLRIGYPRMMELIREDPEAVMYACDVIAEDQKVLVKGVLEESGADGIFYSVQNGEVDRFTEEEYRKWVTPSDKKVLDYANSLSDMNAIHFCAWEERPNRLSIWEDYKAPVVNWSRFFDIMDIKEAKEHFGCTVWGGFDNRENTLFYTVSKEEIEQAVAEMVKEGGKSGYILGADCSIHDSLEDERFNWVADALKKL